MPALKIKQSHTSMLRERLGLHQIYLAYAIWNSLWLSDDGIHTNKKNTNPKIIF